MSILPRLGAVAIALAVVTTACNGTDVTPTSTSPVSTTLTAQSATTTVVDVDVDVDVARVVISCTPGSGPDFAGLEQNAPDFDDESLRCAVFDEGLVSGGSFVDTDLTGAGFRGAQIADARFVRAIMIGADFAGATLTQVRFGATDLRGAVFEDVDLSAVRWSDTICPDGVNSDVADATCEGHLTPVTVVVEATDAVQALAPLEFKPLCAPDSGEDLSNQLLSETDFRRADLRCARFEGSELVGVDFTEADASAAIFDGSTLTQPIFEKTSLFGTSFLGTTIERGQFRDANLIGANLTGAVITDARWANTICPNGVNSDDAGGTCLGSRSALDLDEAAFDEVVDDDITVRQGGGLTTYTIATDVLFAFNSDTLSPEAEAKILLVIASIAERFGTDDQIQVWGHADAVGEAGTNLELSQRRADNVAALLAADPSLDGLDIEAIGLGERQPIASNTKPDGSDNPEGRSLNRRVEIVVRSG